MPGADDLIRRSARQSHPSTQRLTRLAGPLDALGVARRVSLLPQEIPVVQPAAVYSLRAQVLIGVLHAKATPCMPD